ncbi:ParA family protein [Deinococcus koreensis]|uniref:Chromosome partitioning protein ParA n=1 Tax=Deinococcus koreensis TaxID=2054903 RepID=A0A2K3US01_9DEIO|nr:ParA family protein [Deinococcus koreensis]PNY79313.1 chromosome partitioning protein ParA [Deinococcus koreensis]
MIITVAGFKGGVAKTTTAVHLAAYLQALGPTLLVDGDANRSASLWASHGGLNFTVVPEAQAMKHARQFEHIVIDTGARPSGDELRDLVGGCDLLVLPTNPEAMSLDALLQTTEALQNLGGQYRILLTLVPPSPSREGEEARALLEGERLPVMRAAIRQTSAFRHASAQGVPVYAIKGSRSAKVAWWDYERAAAEIVTAVGERA